MQGNRNVFGSFRLRERARLSASNRKVERSSAKLPCFIPLSFQPLYEREHAGSGNLGSPDMSKLGKDLHSIGKTLNDALIILAKTIANIGCKFQFKMSKTS